MPQMFHQQNNNNLYGLGTLVCGIDFSILGRFIFPPNSDGSESFKNKFGFHTLSLCLLFITRKPTNCWGSAWRDVTQPQRLSSIIHAITCSENVHARPYIDSQMTKQKSRQNDWTMQLEHCRLRIWERYVGPICISLVTVFIRSSPQWWSGRSTTAHIVLDLRSPICSFGESFTIVNCVTSQPTNVFPEMCSDDISDDLQKFCYNLKGDFSTPCLGVLENWGWAHSKVRPWVPISSP